MLASMRLYIMRHGPAEDYAAGGDAQRALTAPGRDRVRDVARVLVREEEAPRLILTSPLVRAVQTAEIVHATCSVEAPLETRRELSMGGRGLDLVKELAAEGTKRVMLVGHQPDLSDLVSDVANFRVEMQKAMVVCISIKPEESAKVRFVLDPKSLELRRF